MTFLNCDPDAPLQAGCQWLYFIGESWPALKVPATVKIGISSNVRQRLASFQTSNCRDLQLIYCRQVPTAPAVEKWIHDRFWSKRIRGEWFEITLEEIMWCADLIFDVEIDNSNKPSMLGKLACVGDPAGRKQLTHDWLPSSDDKGPLNEVTWHLVKVPSWASWSWQQKLSFNCSLMFFGHSNGYAHTSVSPKTQLNLYNQRTRHVRILGWSNGFPECCDCGAPTNENKKKGIAKELHWVIHAGEYAYNVDDPFHDLSVPVEEHPQVKKSREFKERKTTCPLAASRRLLRGPVRTKEEDDQLLAEQAERDEAGRARMGY